MDVTTPWSAGRLAELPTPLLAVDVECAAGNHRQLAAAAGGLDVRPHFKAHKTTALLELQRAGTDGAVCVQTPAEAALLARHGTYDIELTNEVADAAALPSLVDAARACERFTVLVDHPHNVELLARAAAMAAREIGVLLEIDVGMHRCGIEVGSDELPRLVEQVSATPGLHLRGIQAYEGHAASTLDASVRAGAVDAAAALAHEALDALAGAFDGSPVVGGGSTGTTAMVASKGPWTETQAGSYLLMDASYGELDDLPYEQALFVVSTVLHVDRRHVVVDAGLKALAVDRGMPRPVDASMRTISVSDEHAKLAVGDVPPRVGERILLVPGHVDPTMNLSPCVALVSRRGSGGVDADGLDLLDVVPVDGRRTFGG